jgi:hypothetical protein
MLGDHTLLESFELDGFWGPSSQPEEQWIPGRLRFNPENGIRLDLLGRFEQTEEERNTPWPYHESLFGLTKDLDKITLLGCNGDQTVLKVHSNRSFFGTVHYRAKFLVMGEHLSKESDMQYSSVVANLHNLEGFIGLRGITSNRTKEGLTLSYAHPETISFSFGKFKVSADYMLNTKWELFRHEIRQHGEFTASADNETTLDEFLRGPLTAFQYLHQLSLGHRVPLTSLEGRSERLKATVNGKTFQQRTQIFFSKSRALPLPDIEYPFNMMFTLRELGSEVSAYLDRWYRAFEDLRAVFDLYFSLDLEADNDVALEHHFLSAILAVEGYHRSAGYDQEAMPPDKHRELVDHASAVAAPECREWLNSKIQFNEKSLRSRLKELYDEQPEKVRVVLRSRKDFCDTIVGTRNSLAHTSSQRKESVLGGLSLLLAIKQLRLLLQTCFLRQMQLPESLLDSCIDKSPDYKTLRFYRIGEK